LSGKDRVLLGDIGAAHGLKGEVRLRSFTETPAAIADYGPLEDETGGKVIEISSVRPGPKGLIARIKGVTTRESAEALTGTKLYVPRDRLPEAEEGAYYHSDLIGLEAYDAFDVQIGTVVAMYNFGAGDIIEVKLLSGGDNLLLPFTDATVPEIDTEERRLTLVLPETDEDEA
jgi:16S rRNA processing protein RimM